MKLDCDKDVYTESKAATTVTRGDIVKKRSEEMKWNHKKYLTNLKKAEKGRE